MIECDICKEWYHGACVGIEEYQAADIDLYHCPNCQPEHGPLVLKRRRNWHRHDYSEINDGKKAIQSGTVAFINKLKKKSFPSAEEVLIRLKGRELNKAYFEQHGFQRPLMVEEKEGLGLKVPPPTFKVSDVERYVGSMRELDVIDVSRQDDFRMKMREWTEYYESTWPRKKVLNVISLEFTGTELDEHVSPPTVVREMDWIERHWPDKLPEDSPFSRPQVQKYCLMSVKDSYTDFHVDFGGTSVWYHILRGEKIFFLIPPTEENLLHYEQWVMSSNQSEIFFGGLVPTCYQCTVYQGNTLFIPTGWIHSVLTPKDSLVFGGNFLHRYSIGLQLRIHEIELRLGTPVKFQHPHYETLTWFAARDLLAELRESLEHQVSPPQYLLDGLKEMVFILRSWIISRESLKFHRPEIPEDVKPSRLMEQLARAITMCEAPLQPVVDTEGRQEGLRFRLRKGSVEESPFLGATPPFPGAPSPQKKAIKMKLSTGESQVVRHNEDEEKKRISIKLSVPQATVVSTTIAEEESDSELSVGELEPQGSRRRGQPRPLEKSFDGQSGGLASAEGRGRRGTRRVPAASEDEWEEESASGSEEDKEEYEDEEFVYPSLVDESEVVSEVGCAMTRAGRRKVEEEDDDLWTPHGPLKLIKGSIASSPRQKRNARKRSFEESLSATAAKIVKLEQDRKEMETVLEPVLSKPRIPLIPESRATDPVMGGGSLGSGLEEGEEGGGRRARAAAAASAVNAILAASKAKTKGRALTSKQRLGKIMGLNKFGGGRWK